MAAVFSRLPMRVRCATQRDHVSHPGMNYSQTQLDQLDRLTERWVADHLQKGKTSKKEKELVTLESRRTGAGSSALFGQRARPSRTVVRGRSAVREGFEARAADDGGTIEGLSDVEIRQSQFSFADWELLRQGVVLEPSLAAIADFLDEHEEIIEAIRGDLRCGLKRPDSGAQGLAAQQVLRSLVLMRGKNWDYRELRERIADGLTLRRFTDFNAQPVPKHDAFQRAFNRVTPQTLRLVNELLIRAAVAMGLEDGRKLRVDTTVVQSDIQHPTDNTLLWVLV